MRRCERARTVTGVRFLLTALAAAILLSPVATAAANPPDGDWT